MGAVEWIGEALDDLFAAIRADRRAERRHRVPSGAAVVRQRGGRRAACERPRAVSCHVLRAPAIKREEEREKEAKAMIKRRERGELTERSPDELNFRARRHTT